MNLINKLQLSLAGQLNQVNEITLSCIESNIKLLNEAGSYFLQSGGKRLRPILTLLCSNMFAYTKDDNNIKLASAIELIHAATLLHDDVIDGSMMRRFKKTVNAIWENKTSILIGDILLSHAFKLMIECKSFEALECLSDVVNKIILGELQQLDLYKDSIMISEKQYYEIIANKTAHLFAGACKVAGIIAEQDQDILQSLYNFGYQLGILFQITDDALDYKMNSNLGKNAGDDFLEGKITLPIILLVENATIEHKNRIKALFSTETRTLSEFNEILQLMLYYNIHEKLSYIILQIKQNIYEILENIEVRDLIQKKYLYDITNYCADRMLLLNTN
jgi:octaprenyl-diphosphate synthase